MPFVDKCKILIKAGNGGNGIVSWRREAHVPLGGPAGGNGGNGGNIFFIGTKNETSLESLVYKKKIVAKNGENGGIKNMHGKNADDVFVYVPLGTIIKNNNGDVVADILIENKKYLIATGGEGGHGNMFFKSGFNKAPTLYELGEKGEEFEALIELKQISNIGLIGLPNAGKSSLITCMTNAKPKIADYQFTTLIPILGTISYNDEKIIIADIPGLIEGASTGIGLGHDFLRHIERCNILVHVVSLAYEDNPNIVESINTIFNELKSYDINLLNKKIIIVANKNDVNEAKEQLDKIKNNFKNYEILSTSCLDDNGIDKLIEKLIELYLENKNKNLINLNDDEIIEWKRSSKNKKELSKEISITKNDDGFYVINCEYLEYWAYRIPINTADNLIRLNQKIASTNMLQLLSQINDINEGDPIQIGKTILYYEK